MRKDCECGGSMVRRDSDDVNSDLICAFVVNYGDHNRSSSAPNAPTARAVVAAPEERILPSTGGCRKCGGSCEASSLGATRAEFTCKPCGHIFRDFTKKTVEAAKAAGLSIIIYAAKFEADTLKERRRSLAELKR